MTSDKTPASDPTSRECATATSWTCSRKVVGQTTAMQSIVPRIQMYQGGAEPGRAPRRHLPAARAHRHRQDARTVEALAEVLHGSEKKVVKIDCGEFQSDHEVAKLIGAPPGYLGHRETQPVLTQEKLSQAISPSAPSRSCCSTRSRRRRRRSRRCSRHPRSRHADARRQHRRQLRAEPHLPHEQPRRARDDEGDEAGPRLPGRGERNPEELASKLENIGVAAVRRRYSPEFVNRIDVVITYQPLDEHALAAILEQHIGDLQRHVNTRLGSRSFEIEVRRRRRSSSCSSAAPAPNAARAS